MAASSSDRSQSPDALVDEIEQTREQLAVTVDALVDRAHPRNIAQRQLERVKGVFVAPDGALRNDQIAKAAGVVVGLVAVVMLIRRVAG